MKKKSSTSSSFAFPPPLQALLYSRFQEALEEDYENNVWQEGVHLGYEEDSLFDVCHKTIRNYFIGSWREMQSREKECRVLFHNFLEQCIAENKLIRAKEDDVVWIRLPHYKNEELHKNILTTLSMWFGWDMVEANGRKQYGTIKLTANELWRLCQLNAAEKK